jgi:hypothetical protein
VPDGDRCHKRKIAALSVRGLELEKWLLDVDGKCLALWEFSLPGIGYE